MVSRTRVVRCADGTYKRVTFRTVRRRPVGDVLWDVWDALNGFMDRMWREHETAMGVLAMLFIGSLILFAGFIEGSDWPN